MINNVVVVGRLTRAVDLRYTNNGTAYASFILATDHLKIKTENVKQILLIV